MVKVEIVCVGVCVEGVPSLYIYTCYRGQSLFLSAFFRSRVLCGMNGENKPDDTQPLTTILLSPHRLATCLWDPDRESPKLLFVSLGAPS